MPVEIKSVRAFLAQYSLDEISWLCPDCQERYAQPVGELSEAGTAVCPECGADCVDPHLAALENWMLSLVVKLQEPAIQAMTPSAIGRELFRM